MTERTLREKIAGLENRAMTLGETDLVRRAEVLAILDAHTAAQPALDTVTDEMVQAVIDHRVKQMRIREAHPELGLCACLGPAAIVGKRSAVQQCRCVRSQIKGELQAALTQPTGERP